ncbi:MAG: hypothetical protein IKM11_01985, partial [Oscillospiraceae bacterium]|nr:hypothetical protein [Oscillospiraceae bacterium]
MENELKVIDLLVIDETYEYAAAADKPAAAPKRKKGAIVLAALTLCVLCAVLALFGRSGTDDTQDESREAAYLEALELLEQGEKEEAQTLLEQIVGYRDSGALLRDILFERWYELGMQHMAKEDYDAALKRFDALGDFRDAREKVEECRTLSTLETAYKEGKKLYDEGKWGAAYLVLLPIRDADYKDASTMLSDIPADSLEYARLYAQRGEMGKALSFLRVIEEIDKTQGEALRAELIGENTFAPDQTFYMFDTTHITGFTVDTPVEDFATVVIYMLLQGKANFSLMSNKAVDRDYLMTRAFQGSDLAQELLPGYGSIYNPSVLVGDNYVNYYMDYEQEYSEHQRTVHLKEFKTFCEDSVRELTEMGLLTDAMTRRQKAEVILNWVGFFLTYDKALTIHDVGVAVEEKRGVCEAFAALYNRMCNLAGIPTYGQVGDTVQSGGVTGRHIWSFSVDEDGNIFYADATWGDLWDIDFGL